MAIRLGLEHPSARGAEDLSTPIRLPGREAIVIEAGVLGYARTPFLLSPAPEPESPLPTRTVLFAEVSLT